jgi:clathrin heavy chain
MLISTAANRTLQIFNIDTKQKVKAHENNENVVFWKWISESALGLVTESSVYHWSITDATSPPQKVFDRHATLAGSQIINYRTSADEKWMVLIGISGNTANPNAFKVKGAMQLYSRERGVSQPIEGHAAAFAEVKLDGNQHVTKLFTFSVRTGNGAKVCLVVSRVFFWVTFGPFSYMLWRSTIRLQTLRSRREPSMYTSHLKLRMTSP